MPAEIIVLSFADSDLTGLGAAAAARAVAAPEIALINLRTLDTPTAVDAFVVDAARGARAIVVRLLGGVGYWPHGIDRLRALVQRGAALIVIPGEARWDPALATLSSVPAEA